MALLLLLLLGAGCLVLGQLLHSVALAVAGAMLLLGAVALRDWILLRGQLVWVGGLMLAAGALGWAVQVLAK